MKTAYAQAVRTLLETTEPFLKIAKKKNDLGFSPAGSNLAKPTGVPLTSEGCADNPARDRLNHSVAAVIQTELGQGGGERLPHGVQVFGTERLIVA